jgi:hypothetical protein
MRLSTTRSPHACDRPVGCYLRRPGGVRLIHGRGEKCYQVIILHFNAQIVAELQRQHPPRDSRGRGGCC